MSETVEYLRAIVAGLDDAARDELRQALQPARAETNQGNQAELQASYAAELARLPKGLDGSRARAELRRKYRAQGWQEMPGELGVDRMRREAAERLEAMRQNQSEGERSALQAAYDAELARLPVGMARPDAKRLLKIKYRKLGLEV